ncbi:MAG: MotA/TolQ/ExbB proton channel family protein [Bdellovibrionaceae bacterium]|nr:MotA/TolQ/ExbB proton channel family protein [Pseudobdellovibrionaceae bacterium]
MNLSPIFGLAMAVGVVITTVIMSTNKPTVFLDSHAAIIVIGGTIAATLLSFSAKTMIGMLKVFFSRVLKGTLNRYDEVITEIVDLAKGYRENSNYLSEKVEDIKTPFLKEAIQMIIAGGLNPKDVDLVLAKRAHTHFKRYEEDSHMFSTLAKFPPAFGLLGAVIGMVTLMQGLGGSDAIKTVGPSMAVALVATMYGIAIANFIFIPLGENLSKYNKSDRIIRQMVIDGIKLIRAKQHPLVVEENIKSYLLPSEREALTNGQENKAA